MTQAACSSDLRRAQQLQRKLISFESACGDVVTANRLALEGPKGYHGVDELDYLARMLGGVAILQMNDQELLYP